MVSSSIPRRKPGRRRKLDPLMELEMLQVLASGETVTAVSEKFGIGRVTVYAIRNRNAEAYLRFLRSHEAA